MKTVFGFLTHCTAGLATAPLLAFAAPALGQTIDYGALERMFGEPVTTSATGKPQRASDVPTNMEILTAEDLRRTGITTISELPRALKNIPGVDVQQTSVGVYNVGIHGYNGPYSSRILVLVNGRQVYLDHYGYTQWSAIPVEIAEIRQVEVVKGANSALFGFNAANGVINIVTYSPLTDKINSASVTYGTQEILSGAAVATGQIGDKFGLRLSAGGLTGSDFQTALPAQSQQNRLDPKRQSVKVDARAKLGESTQAGLELSHTRAKGSELNPGYQFVGGDYTTWSAAGRASAETQIGLIEAQLYHNAMEMDMLDRSGGSSNLTFKNAVTVFQLTDQFKIGTDHSFRPQFEFRRNAMDSTPVGGGEISYMVAGLGGMWDWQLSDSVSWTNSVRGDYLSLARSGALPSETGYTNSDWDQSSLAVSYNSGIVYKATDVDSFRLTAARAIQAPSLVELGLLSIDEASGRNPSIILSGNPRIRPTVVNNYEAGYDRAFPEWGAKFRGSLFYQRTEDVKQISGETRISRNRVFISSSNIGNSEALGFELGVQVKKPSGWRYGANYTYTRITDLYTSNSVQVNTEKGTPQHMIKANIGYSFDRWEIDAHSRYISHIYQSSGNNAGSSLTRIPGYFETDLRVGYRLTDFLTLSLTGTSINLDRHAETSGPEVERRVFAAITASF